MINDSFFPTPAHVTDMLLKPYLKDMERHFYLEGVNQVLEPSAGKGDIVDRLVKHYHLHAKDIACIEIEPELQMILTGKGYKVIGEDFLTYADRYSFDLILMNPPFADGIEHLLKAWDVMRHGNIACILNAETIENPYSEKRKLLRRLIDDNGSYEIVGDVFKDAERKTAVNCAIVWLKKVDKTGGVEFKNDDFDRDAAFNSSDYTANPLANPDIIESLVDQCNKAMQTLVEIDRAQSTYAFYAKGILSEYDLRPKKTLNEQIDELKQGFWRYIFDKTKVGQVTTSSFQSKFEEFTQQTGRLAFSKENILKVLEMFFLNRDQIMKDCLLSVFDAATKYHEKNVIHTEGWKHNKSWKIAPKIILPYGIELSYSWHLAYGNRSARDFYQDIDKVLCFITGEKLTEINTLVWAIEHQCELINRGNVHFSEQFISSFFNVRLYKKGTVHLTFRDKDLLARFNQAAAEGKGWLGAGY